MRRPRGEHGVARKVERSDSVLSAYGREVVQEFGERVPAPEAVDEAWNGTRVARRLTTSQVVRMLQTRPCA